jgi:hypothetical protein
MNRARLLIALLISLAGGCKTPDNNADLGSSVDGPVALMCHGRSDCASNEECCLRASDTINGTIAQSICLPLSDCPIGATVNRRQSFTCSSDSDCASVSSDGGAFACCPATNFNFSGKVCLPHC